MILPSFSQLFPTLLDRGSYVRSPGWVGLSHGLPRHWAWGVFSLVEALHELYAEGISASLAEALEAAASLARGAPGSLLC